jgi:methionine synthase I (cobalamin-dependent)
MKMVTKNQRMGFVRNKIRTNTQWLFRAIEVIYSHQTEDEKMSDSTRHDNGIGFNGVDAEILSSFARQIASWKIDNKGYNCPLSPKQLSIAFKKMPKYAGQIIRVSDHDKLDKIIEADEVAAFQED